MAGRLLCRRGWASLCTCVVCTAVDSQWRAKCGRRFPAGVSSSSGRVCFGNYILPVQFHPHTPTPTPCGLQLVKTFTDFTGWVFSFYIAQLRREENARHLKAKAFCCPPMPERNTNSGGGFTEQGKDTEGKWQEAKEGDSLQKMELKVWAGQRFTSCPVKNEADKPREHSLPVKIHHPVCGESRRLADLPSSQKLGLHSTSRVEILGALQIEKWVIVSVQTQRSADTSFQNHNCGFWTQTVGCI